MATDDKAPASSESSSDEMPRDHVIGGKYRIIEKLGQGGMGSVYKAEHILLGRTVALKLVHRSLTRNPEYLDRFKREALIASRLSHPNAVVIYDFGVDGETPYLVMQFVEGLTLKQVILQEGALPLHRVRNIVRQVGGALAEAHGLGIVHRDLKPDNVMLSHRSDGSECASILDFGIAKPLTTFSGDSGVTLTRAGVLVGTPQYVSPEQALERPCDQRADIYTFGIILYEMITGDVPFKSTSPVEVLFKHINELPRSAREFRPELNVPQRVSDVVGKALAKDPDKRFQTVTELVHAFDEAVEDAAGKTRSAAQRIAPATGSRQSRPVKFVRGVAAFSCVAAVLWLATRSDSRTDNQVALIDSGEPVLESVPLATNESVATPKTVVQPEGLPPIEASPEKPPIPQLPQSDTFIIESPVPPGIATETLPAPSEESASLEPTAPPVNDVIANEAGFAQVDVPVDEEQEPNVSAVFTPPGPQFDQYRVEAIKTFGADLKLSASEIDRRYQEGERLFDEQQYESAASKLREVLATRPSHLKARLSLAASLIRLRQPQIAREHIEIAQKVNAQYPPTLYVLASYYATTGHKEQAVNELRRAIALFPKIRSWVKDDPDFDTLRSEPEFQKLVGG